MKCYKADSLSYATYGANVYMTCTGVPHCLTCSCNSWLLYDDVCIRVPVADVLTSVLRPIMSNAAGTYSRTCDSCVCNDFADSSEHGAV